MIHQIKLELNYEELHELLQALDICLAKTMQISTNYLQDMSKNKDNKHIYEELDILLNESLDERARFSKIKKQILENLKLVEDDKKIEGNKDDHEKSNRQNEFG